MIDLLGAFMRQFNPYTFYDAANALHPLEGLQQGAKLKDSYYMLFMAKAISTQLWNGDILPLVISKPAALKLWQALECVLPSDQAKIQTMDMESEIDYVSAWKIRTALKELETVLSAELQSMNTYFISQTLAYNTADLISSAENMLPEIIRRVIEPTAIADIQQAGRCIAFDLPTGAGFHIMRATESVIRQYHQLVVKLKPKSRNWGKYIEALKKHKADPKIVVVLDQLREMHRNPIMHPEVVLTSDEATTLIGIAQSVIVAMGIDMIRRQSPVTLPAPTTP